MIRQAITCDLCGSEKRQTNHWFVACEQGNELRLSGWSSRNKLRPGAKHLCGQTCLHKLVDDFMARLAAGRAPAVAGQEDPIASAAVATDTSLTADAAYEDVISSARLIPTPLPPRPRLHPTVELAQDRPQSPAQELAATLPSEAPPSFVSRNVRAEAWKREREREMHATLRQPMLARRRSG